MLKGSGLIDQHRQALIMPRQAESRPLTNTLSLHTLMQEPLTLDLERGDVGGSEWHGDSLAAGADSFEGMGGRYGSATSARLALQKARRGDRPKKYRPEYQGTPP